MEKRRVMSERFDRNVRLFGADGQRELRSQTVAVPGVGGLGTHVIQQLSLLGVGGLILIDPEELDVSNKNRYVGVRHDDPVPGTRKIDIGERLVLGIDPSIRVTKLFDSVVSEAGFAALRQATFIFGCLDRESVRLVLTEFAAAYKMPYLDLATEIRTEGGLSYGGRLCLNSGGSGCLMCLGVLDVAEAQRELAGPDPAKDRRAIYGLDADALGEAGPSVVSVNGVVASLAVTKFMVLVTGLRPAQRLLTYHGQSGKVTVSADQPYPDCYYCRSMWGAGDSANLKRYLGQR